MEESEYIHICKDTKRELVSHRFQRNGKKTNPPRPPAPQVIYLSGFLCQKQNFRLNVLIDNKMSWAREIRRELTYRESVSGTSHV